MVHTAASQTTPDDGRTTPRGGGTESLLKQRAYLELKARIQDGTFSAGEFLSERQLAARLGMSKTPVKAALERLEAEGLISVSPQQGIVVREFTVHEVADQFEIREALESFVVQAIAGRLRPGQITRLQTNLQDCLTAALARDVPRSVELDAEFHLLFCEFLGNQEILRVMSQLRDKIHRVIFAVSLRNPDRLLASYEEHAAIAEAILAGEGDLAAQRLVQHLEYGRQQLLSRRSVSA